MCRAAGCFDRMTRASLLQWLRHHRVAVLKGGWSKERAISLKTGQAVEAALRRLKIPVIGIDVRPDIAVTLIKKKIQFCFIALHGPFGEDGRLQASLDALKIPYTGSGALASAIAMDKDLSKRSFSAAGVATAPWVTVYRKGKFQIQNSKFKILNLLKQGPVFIKPVDQGSAIGVSRVTSAAQLQKALNACFRVSHGALVERLIEGREFTVGILGRRPLPVVEIIPKHNFYDFHSKYAKGGSKHLVPAALTMKQTKTVQQLALKAFQALECTVYGRVDLMMDKKERFFVLEVNTIPGMTSTSLLPDAARAAGLSFDDLVLEIVRLSIHA